MSRWLVGVWPKIFPRSTITIAAAGGKIKWGSYYTFCGLNSRAKYDCCSVKYAAGSKAGGVGRGPHGVSVGGGGGLTQTLLGNASNNLVNGCGVAAEEISQKQHQY